MDQVSDPCDHEPTPSPRKSPRKSSEKFTFLPVSAEDLLQLTQDAFGNMIASSLTSEKWDRRSEAIKGIESMLKSQEMRKDSDTKSDAKAQVAAAFRILEHALKDKVWPVLSAGIALYKRALEQASSGKLFSEEELDAAIRLCTPSLAQRLGDAQKRTHDAALDAIERTAKVSFRVSLDVLVEQVGGSSKDLKGASKAFAARLEGVLECLLKIIRLEKLDSSLVQKLCPVLQVAVDHPREKVRSLGLDAVVELGRHGDQPQLQLRPALQQALQARLEVTPSEDDDDEGVELDAPDFMVVGTKAPVTTVAAPKNELEFGDDEEEMMDQILGDTGLIFRDTGKIAINSGCSLGLEQDELEADFLRDLEDLAA